VAGRCVLFVAVPDGAAIPYGVRLLAGPRSAGAPAIAGLEPVWMAEPLTDAGAAVRPWPRQSCSTRRHK